MKKRTGWVIFGGLGYAVALVLIVQLAIVNGFLAGFGLPAHSNRSGSYNSRLPEVAAVDPDQMAKAVAEASGGPPTIALPPPPPELEPTKDDDAKEPSHPAPRPAPITRNPPAAAPPPASIALPPIVPASVAAYIATLPPATQAQIQAQIQAALSKPPPHDD